MKRNNEIKRLVKSINDKITKNEQLVFLFQELFEEIKEELDTKGWKESDFDHIIDLVHRDQDEWEKGHMIQGEFK